MIVVVLVDGIGAGVAVGSGVASDANAVRHRHDNIRTARKIDIILFMTDFLSYQYFEYKLRFSGVELCAKERLSRPLYAFSCAGECIPL